MYAYRIYIYIRYVYIYIVYIYCIYIYEKSTSFGEISCITHPASFIFSSNLTTRHCQEAAFLAHQKSRKAPQKLISVTPWKFNSEPFTPESHATGRRSSPFLGPGHSVQFSLPTKKMGPGMPDAVINGVKYPYK